MTAEVRHPHSRVLLQGVRRIGAREMLEPEDWVSDENGTWRKCPTSRVGTRVEQSELDHKVVWTRPIEEPSDDNTPLNVRLAAVEAGMGSMHRLW